MTKTALEREANRFIAVRASKNGVPVTAQQYAITERDIRPEAIPEDAWINVVTKGPDVGFYHPHSLIGQGTYTVWAKWHDGLEDPVENAGILVIN